MTKPGKKIGKRCVGKQKKTSYEQPREVTKHMKKSNYGKGHALFIKKNSILLLSMSKRNLVVATSFHSSRKKHSAAATKAG